MLYRKIKASWRDEEKRFFRIILVDPDISLFDAAIAILTSLGATFEHLFEVHKGREYYSIPDPEDEDLHWGQSHNIFDYQLTDISDAFKITYDFGDEWVFHCKAYKRLVEIRSDEPLILLDGAGQGIWEDNIWTLWAYIGGDMDSNTGTPDGESDYAKPWNFTIESWSDFDAPLNIPVLSKKLSENYQSNLKEFHKQYKSELRGRKKKSPVKDSLPKPASSVSYDFSPQIAESYNKLLQVITRKAMDTVIKKVKSGEIMPGLTEIEHLMLSMPAAVLNELSEEIAGRDLFDEPVYRKILNKYLKKP